MARQNLVSTIERGSSHFSTNSLHGGGEDVGHSEPPRAAPQRGLGIASSAAAADEPIEGNLEQLIARIGAQPLLAADRHATILARSRRPQIKQSELFTWLDAFLLLAFADQPQHRRALLVRWSPATVERYSRHLQRLVQAEPRTAEWSEEFLLVQVRAQIHRATASGAGWSGGTPQAPVGSVQQLLFAVSAFFSILPASRLPFWFKTPKIAAR